MSIAVLFWVLMLFNLVLNFWSLWPLSGANARPAAGNLLLFAVLCILGYAQFGGPIK